MIPPKNFRTLIFLGVAILSAVLLAAGLSTFELQPGRKLPIAALMESMNRMRDPYTGGGTLPFDPFRLIVVFIWIALIASVILLIISSEARREFFKRITTYLLLTLLVYGAILAFRPDFSLVGEFLEPPEIAKLPDTGLPDEPLPTPPDYIFNPPQWLVIAVTLLFIVIPTGIIWLIWNFFAPKKQPPPKTSLEQVTQAAQVALTELESGSDLKDTVLRCYRDMSHLLSKDRGLYRRQGMTPREFEQYLSERGLRTEHIHRLTRLFEQVRYGGNLPGKRDELEAKDCLNAIIKTYGSAL